MRLPTLLSRRRLNSHKGDYGHILILAGSARYSGAAVLCAEAAMRSGAGLVTLGIPSGLNNAVIKIKPKEVMTLPLPQTRAQSLSLSGYGRIKSFLKEADVVLLGPGLSRDRSTQKLARKIVEGAGRPLVIDADALNALAGNIEALRSRAKKPVSTVITPHPGEMGRLLHRGVAAVQRDRKAIAKKFAFDYNVTVVLKGHQTVVADNRSRFYINKTGNPGMATAGSGDVLSGMIAAFLGQKLDAFSAAKYAVYLHGMAGDLAAKEKTQLALVASDIIDKIPEAIKRCS
jgi:ADP-dependent NAD(P)H-hydrate dehydratase / NAD(P)H-hydrate epimerase